MYRKGRGPSNLSGLDKNPDYTCPDKAELPVIKLAFCRKMVIDQAYVNYFHYIKVANTPLKSVSD